MLQWSSILSRRFLQEPRAQLELKSATQPGAVVLCVVQLCPRYETHRAGRHLTTGRGEESPSRVALSSISHSMRDSSFTKIYVLF